MIYYCEKCGVAHSLENEALLCCANIEPSHYTQFKIPPNVYITDNRLEWEEGNIIKYITRHRFKNGAEDVRKAIKYAELLLERMYGEKK